MHTQPRSLARSRIRRLLHRAVVWAAAAVTAAAGLAIVAPAAPAHAADEIHFTVDGDCTLSRGVAVAAALSLYYGGSHAVSCGAQSGAGNQATPVIMSLTDDVTLTSPLPELFGAPVVIQGHGHTIARAQGADPFRLFTVTDGGAAKNPGDLTITDAVLTGGKVTGASGTDGDDGAPGMICPGTNNHASGCKGTGGSDGTGAQGGAISVDHSSLTLTRVVVTGNSAVAGAGGDGGTGRDGPASSDSASGRWGGNGGNGGDGASAFGGGVYAVSSDVTISDSLFTDNTLTAGDGGDGGDAGDGGDGAPGTDAKCDAFGTAHSGDAGTDAGWGGDGGDGSIGGRAYGAAVYARFGDVRVQRTSIVENTAHAGDAGARGAAGSGGDTEAGEDVACGGAGAGGTSALGGAAGVPGGDGNAGASGIAGDALGAAVFFDGYSDNAKIGNTAGSFTLAESTVAQTAAEPGGGATNPNRYTDCETYKESEESTTHHKQVCDAMWRDHGVGSAVAGDGAMSVVASTITDNTTTLKLDTDDFDDDWQLNAGIMQAWVSDTFILARGPDSPNWHSTHWTPLEWEPTVAVTVTSSIIGPNYLTTTDGTRHLPDDCREIVDQRGGDVGTPDADPGYYVWPMTVSSGGHNIVYAESASASSACMSGGAGDTHLTADDIGDTLGAYDSLLASYTLPGGNASYGYTPRGAALGNGSTCTDGAADGDAGLDQTGHDKPTSGCDIGAVQASSQSIDLDVKVSGYATYGDDAPDFRIRSSDIPEGLRAGTVSCDLDGVTWSSSLDADNYAIDLSTCSGSLTGIGASHYDLHFTQDGGFVQGRASLTVSGSDATVTYQDKVPAITPVYDGFVNDETAAGLIDAAELTAPDSCSTDYTASSDVATYDTWCDGATARNYSIVQGTGSVTVTPQSVDVGIGGTMRYGEAAHFTLYPEYTSLTFDAQGLTCTKDADGETLTGLHYRAEDYRIDPDSCNGPERDLTGNYVANYTSRGFAVTTAPLYVTPRVTNGVYGSDVTITPTYDGFANGEDAAVLTAAPTCSSDYSAGMPIGSYTATCAGGSAIDYTLHYSSVDFTVAAKLLRVSINATQTYGGTPVFSAKVLSQDPSDRAAFPSDATVSCTTVDGGPISGLDVAFYRMDTASCTGPAKDASGNYAFRYSAGLLQVTPAPLTVTAANTQAHYGDAAPTVDPVYTGFVGSDDAADLSTPAVCETTNYDAGDAVGDYVSTCDDATSHNYTVTYVSGQLTVAPAPLTVHPQDVTMAFNSPVPALTIGYDGFVAGDDDTVLTAAAECTVFDAALRPITPLSRPGVYPITCTGGDAPNYVLTGLADPATLTILDPTTFSLFVTPATVFDGQDVAISGGVLPPGTTLAFTFHSDPVPAGSATADATGLFQQAFTVPVATAAAAHEVHATATLPDGTQLEQTAPVTVAAAPSGEPDPGSTGGTDPGDSGEPNPGSTGGTDPGASGGSDGSSTGGSDPGPTGGTDPGDSGEPNPGSTGGSDTGSTGGTNSGGSGGSDAGSTGTADTAAAGSSGGSATGGSSGGSATGDSSGGADTGTPNGADTGTPNATDPSGILAITGSAVHAGAVAALSAHVVALGAGLVLLIELRRRSARQRRRAR